MDTEGIDALDAHGTDDARILAMAIMLSSVFCFNSTGHMDESQVQSLSFMTRVASAVGSGSGHSPTLYWILRDFNLRLADKEGRPMSHSEYIESALSHPPDSKCATREAIRGLFPTRHLVTLPRPTSGESVLGLESRAERVLSDQFKNAFGRFAPTSSRAAGPSWRAGSPSTGPCSSDSAAP